ncbi:cation:proton antiporter [Patescibacteria group bacterium]|nr:cation:proton antiporter [Patescibacteria group bacterium]
MEQMSLFAELSILFLAAAGIALCFQFFRLPTVVGYLLVGLTLGPFAFGVLQSAEVFELLAQIGMCALLFSVGLHVNRKALKDMGKTVVKIGVLQIALNLTAGVVIGRLIGFGWVAAGLLGAALSFNSTVLALRSLGERGDLNRSHGKITTGILLLQDIFATIALLVVGILPLQKSPSAILVVLGHGVLLLVLVAVFARFILPKLVERAARSQELLAIGSLAFALGMATAFHGIGWSYELGALIAGVCLASTNYRFEIESKLKPVRELFLVVFFVLLGTKIDPATLGSGWGVAALLIALILVVNPWVIGRLMRHFGHARTPSFLVAVHLAHLSEFSLLLLFVASRSLPLPDNFISSVTVAVGITMLGGSLLMTNADRIRRFAEQILGKKQEAKQPDTEGSEQYEVILFGCHRVGSDFLPAMKKLKEPYLVVDFDPEAIADLQAHNIPCRYGDAEDPEFLREIGAYKAKLIISTIPSLQANTALLALRRAHRPAGVMVLVAQTIEAALTLYRQGATYVILPHVLGGNYASQLVESYGLKKDAFANERTRHIAHLKRRGSYVASVPMLSHGRWR